MIPRLLVLSKDTQAFPDLSNISGQRLGASWHKAVLSASATAFRRAENLGIGPYCREAAENRTRLCTVTAKTY